MEKENYFVLLELPIDPPATDPGQIRAAINKKKQEWTRWQDHPAKRTQALAYLAALPDIEQVMFNTAQRNVQAREAQVIAAEMTRRFEAELRILEGKGYLLPREVNAIAVKYKVYGITQQKVRAFARVPVSDHAPESKTEESGEVLDSLAAKTIRRNLDILGKQDLYAFLGEPQYSSIKKLETAAERQRRSAAAGVKSAMGVATQELSGICLRLFKSFDIKQRYDRYLKISAYPDLGEMIENEFTRSRHISNTALLRLVNYAVEALGCKVLEAEDFIRRYCASYRIPVGDVKPLISCPACKEKTTRESVVCPSCAAPLRGDCPTCGTAFEEGPVACGACAFLLRDMRKALPYLEQAHGAVIDGSWSTARRSLEYVRKYWPGHPEIEPLKKRARLLEERYAWYVDQINDCMNRCQYYAAAALLEEAEEKHIRLPSAIICQIKKVIDGLERELETIAAAPQQNVGRLLELSLSVTDSIELARMLSRHPPPSPDSLGASVSGRQVSLRWSSNGRAGKLEYVLVRGSGAAPVTAFDGDILYEGPANSYIDSSTGALTEYYYSVFSRRGGAYCKTGATFGPVMIIPEIEGLRVLPADQGAQLFWNFNPDIREVLIWRKLGGERPIAPGDGILLETSRTDGFMDTKIKNEVDYWYYLVAVYIADGRRIRSRGVCETITPHKILAPVDQLNIVKSEYGENEFVVRWQGVEKRNLILLSSTRPPTFRPGEIFPVKELLFSYRNLWLHTRSDDSGVFRHSFTGGIYIFAAVVFGKFAVVGKPQFLANLREVDQISADFIDGDLYLNMRWPAGISEIAVVWRADSFPKSIDELGAKVLRVSREQYDHDAGVVLRDVTPGAYYFTIYSLCQGPDGNRFVSDGVEFLYKNLPRQEIFYRFFYKKRAFKNQAEFIVSLSGTLSFAMPKAVVVAQTGRLPLHRMDGKPLLELDQEPKIDGEVLFQYQIDNLPAGTHLRLFLLDDARYERLRLLPASELAVN